MRGYLFTLTVAAALQVADSFRPATTSSSSFSSALFDAPRQREVTRRASACWVVPIVSATAAAAGILLTPPAAFAEGANLLNGATLFQANCAGCHAGGMNFISGKKTLKKEALERYQSLDQATIQKFVQQGMPHKFLPFAKTFTDSDYLDATSFVLDQALNDKW